MRLYLVLALACTVLYSTAVCAQALDEIRSHPVLYGPLPERGPLVWTPPPPEPAVMRVVLGI
jgi:hypothetical protein